MLLAGKARKYLLLSAGALAAVPLAFDLLKLYDVRAANTVVYLDGGYNAGDPPQFFVGAYVSQSVQLVYYTVCICAMAYFCIVTAKQAKNYQPPAGASNAAETTDKMKRFYHLTTRVLILNSFFTIFLFWCTLHLLIANACQLNTFYGTILDGTNALESMNFKDFANFIIMCLVWFGMREIGRDQLPCSLRILV